MMATLRILSPFVKNVSKSHRSSRLLLYTEVFSRNISAPRSRSKSDETKNNPETHLDLYSTIANNKQSIHMIVSIGCMTGICPRHMNDKSHKMSPIHTDMMRILANLISWSIA